MFEYNFFIRVPISETIQKDIQIVIKTKHIIIRPRGFNSPEHTLHEGLRTHKVFTKDQCFYLNYHKFSIKSYVLDVY